VSRTILAVVVLSLLCTQALAQPAPAPPAPPQPAPKTKEPTPTEEASPAAPPKDATPAADTEAEGDPRSKDAKAACVDAFTAAQRLRDVGKLVAARAELMFCSLQPCPELLRNECVPWLEQVTLAIPTIVVAAKDTQGNDTVAVRVRVDEQVAAKVLDGRPIMIDPGPHTLTFEHEGERPVEQAIVVRQGELNRRVEVDFSIFRPTWGKPAVAGDAPSAAAPTTTVPTSKPIPVLVPTMFAVAGGTAVVGAITGAFSLVRANQLETECASATGCSQNDIDEGAAFAHVSTASFSVAAAALLVGVVALVVSWPRRERASIAPLLGPGTAGVRGRF
jgi:hypothetical protein